MWIILISFDIIKSEKYIELTASEANGGLGLGCTRSTACGVCCVCGGLPLLRKLRFSGAGVLSLCGVSAGVRGGVCVGLEEPGSGLPSSESFRLFVRILAISASWLSTGLETTLNTEHKWVWLLTTLNDI